METQNDGRSSQNEPVPPVSVPPQPPSLSPRAEQRSRAVDESVLMAVLGAALLAFFMLLGDRCTEKSASASTSSCETITNADRRNLCRARTTGSPSWCSFIKDKDLRTLCYIEVKK